MTINEAIKKALQNGYTFTPQTLREEENSHFLDPLFWQSLGKALGWVADFEEADGSIYNRWLIEWHRFIDHLAEGKIAEIFFESL